MPIRTAEAVWEGSFTDGAGKMAFGGGAFEGQYSASSRFEEGEGTNPEELLGAAHAGCFSMALTLDLNKAGFEPSRVETTAEVHLNKVDGRQTITLINLRCQAEVPGIDEAQFQQIAEATKSACPVSRALSATEITLEATLKN